jgi:hypothetical protein
MDKPEQSITLPLEYAAQIVFELHSMRRECSQFASHLLSHQVLTESDMEECIRFDDALSGAARVLQAALDGIQIDRTKRRAL